MNCHTLSRVYRPACCFFLCSIALVFTAVGPEALAAPGTAIHCEDPFPLPWQIAQAADTHEAPAIVDTIADDAPPPPELTRTSLSYRTIAGWTIAFMLSTSAAFAIWAGLMIYKTNKKKS